MPEWFLFGCGFGAALVLGAVMLLLFRKHWSVERAMGKKLELLEEAKAKAEAEAANMARGDFLANMSHEIRTPLNSMLGVAELLLEMELTPRQEKHVRTVLQSAENLMDIINDILDFSWIDSGRLELEPVAFDFYALVEETVELFQPNVQSEKPGLRLAIEYPKDAARWLVGDAVRVRQVLCNLVSNAIKFTEQGEVCVRVAVYEPSEEWNPAWVECAVVDSGVGIWPEKFGVIFDKFQQADVSTARQYGGSGLGLAICKQLCELMGGKISVESAVGKGSVFRFALPLPLADVLPGDTLEPVRNVETLWRKGARVLLVEDNRVNREFATELLEGLYCEVVTAEHGQEAIARMCEGRFDLVLVDCQMPVMDGFEAARALSGMMRDGELEPVPILALTANAMKGDRERCLDCGMSDYLAKPMRKADLRQALIRWLPVEEGRRVA